MISRLFGFFRSRTLWIIIGVVVLCLLIWTIGPLFAFGDFHPLEKESIRWLLIGLILLYVLVRLLIARWRSGRINERVANMLRSALSTDAESGKAQTAVLSNRFSEALEVLRKARFESEQPSLWGRIIRRRRYIYELPWYMIIGAPGVGKTTALLNSGLSFPLSRQIGAAAIRGAGGTRNCDWWFTNEAVFLDTAGRYTTHETDTQTDRAEWRGFLSLLKKNRTRQPINGVLVMLSVAELLGQGPEERRDHAATLRNRLDELRGDLGMSPPVYLLVNKCDLLLGFDEYFSTLDRAGRAQVWGTTLPLDPSGNYLFDASQIADECNLLQSRIVNGLVDVLQAEPDLHRRELIYTFPQQFGALIQVLKEMVSGLLTTSRFSESPLFRGIYFTSATQEGTPFDRMVHVLEQGFARPQKAAVAGEGKAYFLQELLSKVIFGEAHIAGQDRRAEKRSYAWHFAGYVLSAFALTGMGLAWAKSYRNNLTYLAEVDQKIPELEKSLSRLPTGVSADVGTLLPVLNRVDSSLDSALFKVNHPPMAWRFGLYQGTRLRRALQPLYEELLSRQLLPTVTTHLERQLQQIKTDDVAYSYEMLKTYLMLSEPKHFNENEFAVFIERGFSGETGDGASLARHIKALLALKDQTSAAKNEALIRQSREQLLGTSPATRALRVLNWVEGRVQRKNLRPFSLSDEVGGRIFPLTFKSGRQSVNATISPLYTAEGYQEFKKERDAVVNLITRDEAWVLDMDARVLEEVTSGKLRQDVNRSFADSYIKNWKDYVDDVGVAEPVSLGEAMRAVNALAGMNSPLIALMKGVARETELVKEPGNNVASTASSSVGRDVQNARNRLTGVANDLNSLVGATELFPKDDPAIEITRYFADLHRFVNGSGGDGSNAPIMGEINRLKQIGQLLEQAVNAGRDRQAMPNSNLLSSLVPPSGSVPGLFREAVKSVADGGKKAIDGTIKKGSTERLHEVVTEFCMKVTKSSYPFVNSIENSISASNFAELFGPNGRMEQFRGEQGAAVDLPEAFKQARNIKEIFFHSGGQAGFSFTIRPIEMDGNIMPLTMQIGDVSFTYRHDRIDEKAVNWSGQGDVRITLAPPIPGGTNEVKLPLGFWAVHQLFERYGKIRRISSGAFQVEINIGGRRATFEVKTDGAYDPFNLTELRRFRCPQTMPGG